VAFPHEDKDFADLIEAAAQPTGLPASLVEKDYWVSHTLWAIQQAGFELWFKGGTSLSKGFQLIERFSEDLDIKLEKAGLPSVTSWSSESKGRIAEREAFFRALLGELPVLGEEGTSLDEEQIDARWRSTNYHVHYPGHFKADIGGPNRSYVLLEVGSARVSPFVEKDLTSFAHALLRDQGKLQDYDDNQPRGVRCIHPLVTLLEKLEAISRRFEAGHDPAAFARHYEDAARIIRGTLPDLEAGPAELYKQMHDTRDLRRDIQAGDPAFLPSDGEHWAAVEKAHAEIGHMFWGDRVPIAEACEAIRDWIAGNIAQQ
jgi:hypothetical protein